MWPGAGLVVLGFGPSASIPILRIKRLTRLRLMGKPSPLSVLAIRRAPRPANDNDLEAMRRIDALFTARPFFGARRIAKTLNRDGFPIDRKRVGRLMRKMGIEALGPKPRTTKPAPGHKIYPYLLRDLKIERPGHVWAADITYIPLGKGFLYLVAVIDWASRAVLSWRLRLATERRWRCGAKARAVHSAQRLWT